MTASSIFDYVLVSDEFHPQALNHYHIVCANKEEQQDFVRTLKEHSEDESVYYIADGSCLLIDDNPKDLLTVIFRALNGSLLKFKNVADFLKFFHSFLNTLSSHDDKIILCLRRAEILRDIEDSPIIMDMFRGFGDAEFRKRVRIITLSTIPWSLMLNNSSVSVGCMNLTYKPYGDNCPVYRIVRKIQTKKLSMNPEDAENQRKLSRNFIKQCCEFLESRISDPYKLFSMCQRVAAFCETLTDPYDDEYDVDVVKKALRKIDLGNSSKLTGKKTIQGDKHQEAIKSIPYFAKFVLVAAFCCSYNRKTTDLRFFDKERECKKRRHTIKSSTDVNKFHETGPQIFTLTRLLGVVLFFYNDFLKPCDGIPDVLLLINKLCDMGLMTRMTPLQNLTNAKFRCDATSDLVRDVARSVDIDIANYLDGDTHDLVNRLQLINVN